jgi:hypothetical protein
VVQLVIEPALVHLSFVALIEQAAHSFELLDGFCIGPSLKDELWDVQIVAAAVPCAQGSSVHEKELSADPCSGLLLHIGWGREHFHAAGALAIERVEVEQDRRHDFGHDIGIDHKGRH